jgi:HAE1 family hydrophobic/amphiphilic exporter-1
MQAESDFRQEVSDISRLFVRNRDGGMVPLDTLTSWQAGTGARFLQRYNLYRTASFSGSPAPGASSGDTIKALEEVAAEVLPDGYGFEWSGQSKQEIEAGSSSTIVLALSIVVVFLFLAALYESWAVLFVVLLTWIGFLGALTLARQDCFNAWPDRLVTLVDFRQNAISSSSSRS